jgi:hypothetical protein
MPGVAEHCTGGELTSRILGIKDFDFLLDFLLGNILPDIMSGDKDATHFKQARATHLVPDLEAADKGLKLLKFSSGVELGYKNHLLVDEYYLDEQVPRLRRIGGDTLFSSGQVKKDYSRMNAQILGFFGIDKDKWNDKIFARAQNCGVQIDDEKLGCMIEHFNRPSLGKEPKLFDFNKYCDFIVKMSFKVAKDLEKHKAETIERILGQLGLHSDLSKLSSPYIGTSKQASDALMRLGQFGINRDQAIEMLQGQKTEKKSDL